VPEFFCYSRKPPLLAPFAKKHQDPQNSMIHADALNVHDDNKGSRKIFENEAIIEEKNELEVPKLSFSGGKTLSATKVKTAKKGMT
jgi:hypothetical protein